MTGFSIAEIDGLIEGLALEEPGDPDDDILPGDGGAPRCRPGDLWQLGPHRLICGNALEPDTVAALMDGGRAQMVFTDPPYNVPIEGNVGGLGSIKHREFAMASGEMTRPEFTSFLRTTFTRLRELFGISPEEIIADPDALFSRHGPEIVPSSASACARHPNSLTMWDVEATIITPDGKKKYTHAIARPERQENGAVTWTGIILDETRTREALLESIAQGVLFFDSDDKLVLRNSHYLALFPELEHVAVPGAAYRDVVCRELASSRELSL